MWGRVPTPSFPPRFWTGQPLLPILQEVFLGRDAPRAPLMDRKTWRAAVYGVAKSQT